MNSISTRTEPQLPLPVRIPVVVSGRHAHLTAAVIEQLFCDRYRLHPNGVSLQGDQFAAIETVNLIGPQGRIRKVPVIGPPRAMNQIEISRSDALILGLRVPVRGSGDLIGTPGLTLEGPRSQVTLGTGVICALRHIHMNLDDAKRLGLKHGDRIEVSTQGINRCLCFQDVIVRVAPHFSLELHLDADESNAAGVQTGDFAVLNRVSLNPTVESQDGI